jgi:hypothetical protein
MQDTMPPQRPAEPQDTRAFDLPAVDERPAPEPAPIVAPAAAPARPGQRAAAAALQTGAQSRTVPARGGTPPPRPGRAGASTASPPPPRRTGRTAALVAVGVLAALVLGVVAVTQLGGSDDAATTTTSAAGQRADASAPVSRGTTTVAVLNGTTVPGLAAQISDQLEKAGFARGATTNAADQQRPDTTVVYAKGFKPAAEEVAKIVGVATIAPMDANTQAIAGPDASVVVTVGADRTQ